MSDYKIKINSLTKATKHKATKHKANNDKSDDDTTHINELANNFLEAYLNYDDTTENKIYEKIKPYSTAFLQNKYHLNGKYDLQSDVHFTSSIVNVRIYNKEKTDNYDMSVLVLADQQIKREDINSSAPLLFEMKLKKLNDVWLVDDFQMNTLKSDKTLN